MHCEIVLIGDPVAHSLSPVMHNALYTYLGRKDWKFQDWHYQAIRCADEASASLEIARVRSGQYRGMNITMPYKPLAAKQADYVDSAADAAGGANVLVRKGFDLYAYNTDGLGAVGAIAREGGIDPRGKKAAVCGTGPTSLAIACALANAHAHEVTLFSRDYDKAAEAVTRLRLSLPESVGNWIRAASYDQAQRYVGKADILVDATPRGMHEGDEAIIDTELLHEGQVVLDTVYAHGKTALVTGARAQGATTLDGFEMLVEQAALSVEIWADALGISVKVPRNIMRTAVLNSPPALQ